MIAGTRTVATVVLALCCLAVMSSSSFAADQAALSGCSSLYDAIERPDGSIVAIGITGECVSPENPVPVSKLLLANFAHDGFPGHAFDGETFVEVATENGGGAIELIARNDGGFYLVASRRVSSYLANGELDTSFGIGGHVFPTEGQVSYSSVQDVHLDSNGSLLVAAGIYGDLRISRYESNGTLSDTFGEEGVATLGLGTGATLGVDPAGRIVVAAHNGLARLGQQGSIDPTFGAHGTGYADLPTELSMAVDGIFEVSFAPDRKVKIAGVGSRGFYSNPGFVVTLDQDGRVIGGEDPVLRYNNPNTIVSYPGGLAYAAGPSRASTPTFSIGTLSLPQPSTYLISPGEARANGIVPTSDGSLLAVGSSGGANCVSRCEFFSSMAMAKLDPETGDLVESFGTKGTRWVQPNRCSFGQTGQIGEWNVCRVEPPAPKGSVKFHGVRKNRPSAAIFARLGPPPVDMWGTEQRFDITLPKRLKLSRSGLKGKIVASVRPEILADRKVVVKGRRISVLVEPDYQSYQGEWGPIGEDKTIRIRVRIKPGALVPISRRQRLKDFRFDLRGTFVPVAGGVALANSKTLWFAPNSKSIQIRAGKG